MLSSLVTFTGEIADTKVVLLLHKEKKKKKINKQEESCLAVSLSVMVTEVESLLCLSDQIAIILK